MMFDVRCANLQGHDSVALDSQAFQASPSPQPKSAFLISAPIWASQLVWQDLLRRPWSWQLLCGFPFPGSLFWLLPQPEMCSTTLTCGQAYKCVHTTMQGSPTCLLALPTSSFPSRRLQHALTPSPFSVIRLGPQPVSHTGCFTVITSKKAPIIPASQMGKLRPGLGRSHLPPARKQES